VADIQSDFGRLISGEALGVAHPKTLTELAALVGEARRRGTPLSIRGAGMSQSGQCLAAGGLVVVMSDWKRLEVDRARQTVTCEPGVRWRDLLEATLPLGLAPKVQPLNLDLSVAGTLSAGGLGSTSHREGFAASHVRSARVVLGSGDLVTTGPTLERDVFDAVFGGVGRCGIIASVEIQLEPAPPEVEVITLRYDDVNALVSDQVLLAGRDRAYHVGAICAASVHGLRKNAAGRREPLRRWSFGLEVAVKQDRGRASSDGLLDELRYAEILHRERDDLGSFLARYDIRFEMMRVSGAWQQAHPWFEALVPLHEAENTFHHLMNLPPFLGDGHRMAIVADTDRPTSIAFPGSGPAMMIAVLPIGVPEPLVPAVVRSLAALDAHIYAVGGRRYLSGWLSRTGEFSWQSHYGDDHPRLVSLKRRFDPSDVFRSKLVPLDPRAAS
jgi:cytokinin dehydrogenase